jgi:hypothetical protein
MKSLEEKLLELSIPPLLKTGATTYKDSAEVVKYMKQKALLIGDKLLQENRDSVEFCAAVQEYQKYIGKMKIK